MVLKFVAGTHNMCASAQRATDWMMIIGATIKETLSKSFDRLRTNGNFLIPFVLS
jgi:hypothetical protein